MKLEEYLWEFRISRTAFGKKIGVNRATVMKIATRKASPGLKLAIAIYNATNGVVTFQEMLSLKDCE